MNILEIKGKKKKKKKEKKMFKCISRIFRKKKKAEEKEINNDHYRVIRAGNITVAQGWECSKCGLIRPSNRSKCSCNL